MSHQKDHYSGLWRGSANEGMPYTDDFPEPLLVLRELLDGAYGEGQASIIDTIFDLTDPNECSLTVEDNGIGIKKESRLKRWMANEGGENHSTESVYSHGSKKCITKWAPNYDEAEWSVSWRKKDRRGSLGALHVLSSPFLGEDTTHEEYDGGEPDEICKNGGTKWKIKFNISVLNNINTPKKLDDALHEIIRTRYTPQFYERCEIKTTIKGSDDTNLVRSTKEFMSLEESLKDKFDRGDNVIKLYEFTVTSKDEKTTASVAFYKMLGDGRVNKIDGLPTYGRKNMASSRVHLARTNCYIEAKSYSKWVGKEQHNSDNGTIGFIRFTSDTDDLPTPATTKVALRTECPIYREMDDIIKQQMKKVDSDKKNKKKKAAKLSMKHTSKEPMPPQYTADTSNADTSNADTSNADTSNAGTSSGSSHNTVSDVELTSPQQSAVSSVSTCATMSEPSTSKEDTHKQITLDVASINTIEHNNDTQQSIGLETVFRANDDDHIYSRNDIKLICTHFDIDFAKAEQLLRERQLE
jgi:hypothetical protein